MMEWGVIKEWAGYYNGVGGVLYRSGRIVITEELRFYISMGRTLRWSRA